MPRVSDVDTIAPDDPVVTKTKKVKKTVQASVVDYQNSNPNAQFRDKINEILGHTTNPLSAFLVNPKVFSFEEKADDEAILLVLRPHWFTNVGWILTTIVLIFIPMFLPLSTIFSGFPANYMFVTIIFWYVVTFIFAFEKFLSWYFNVFIITDERVVDIDFNNLLVKKFSEAKINMIQDVTSNVVGLLPTMFNFGNVLIQTAAEINEITFENVPNPEKVIKVLQQLRQEEELEALQGRIN
ncbi:MAG: PH domain-containing protein [Candidatus Shapirobacteria bacterium]|nr:PH domain-containing protein [Candidatus Shapirobacteria bacterium]